MWWIWGMLACKAPTNSPVDSSPGSSTSETATTPTEPTGRTDTGSTQPGDFCDVPLVDADAPAVVFDRPPKNLIVLSIDTLRRDYVDFYNCHGDGVSRMPFLSTILGQSVTLEDVQQCSNWTFPSTNCTLSGTLLEEMAHVPRAGLDGRPVPDGQRTLARILSDAGFFTGFVWSNGWFYRIANPRLPLEDQLTGNSQGYQVLENGGGALSVGDAGVAMMREALAGPDAPERWLMHLHFIEPHDLYTAPDELMPELSSLPSVPVDFRSGPSFHEAQADYDGLSDADKALYRQHFQLHYTGDLRMLDSRLQQVWARLDDEGLLDDALVVIWTDHGESFWERGPQAHGWRMGAEENDAILAFWHPDLEPARIVGPSHAIDFLPTTLAALGLPVPGDLQGVRAGTAPDDRVRYSATSNIISYRYQSVTRDGLKLIVGWDGSAALHDRNTDRKELTDILASNPKAAGELWSLLRPRVTMLQALIPEGQQPDLAELDDKLGSP